MHGSLYHIQTTIDNDVVIWADLDDIHILSTKIKLEPHMIVSSKLYIINGITENLGKAECCECWECIRKL